MVHSFTDDRELVQDRVLQDRVKNKLIETRSSTHVLLNSMRALQYVL